MSKEGRLSYVRDVLGKNIAPMTEVIAHNMVSELPSDLWVDSDLKDKKFLDLCCKSGLLLVTLREQLMNAPAMIYAFDDEDARRKHIDEHMLYGFALSKESAEISRRELYGRGYIEGNIIQPYESYDDYLAEFTVTEYCVCTDIAKKVMEIFSVKEKNIKFDIVVGNPPFTFVSKDTYLDFVYIGCALTYKYLSMITPASWQTSSSEKSRDFKNRLVQHINKIHYYPDALDAFDSQIVSGVVSFVMDSGSHVECEVINSSVLQPKVNSTETRSILHGETFWNIGNSVVEKVKRYNTYKFNEVTKPSRYTLNVSKYAVISVGTSGCYDWDVGIIKPEYIGKGGTLFDRDGSVSIIAKSTVLDNEGGCKKPISSVDIFTSNNKQECEYFQSWLHTKFIRFLILVSINNLNIMCKEGFRLVPKILGFNHMFTDAELYKHYGLSEEEIDFIESVIK